MLAVILAVVACGDDTTVTETSETAAATTSSQGTTTIGPPETSAAALEFTIRSPAFEDGGDIDIRYSCEGDNISPKINWTGVPAGAGSLALTVTDPDAENFLHWVVWNIPPDSTGFAEDVPGDAELPDGTRQGENEFAPCAAPGEATPGGSAFKTIGYDGPCPGGPHTYVFSVFALSSTIDLPVGTAYREVQAAISAAADDGSLIEKISFSGVFTPGV